MPLKVNFDRLESFPAPKTKSSERRSAAAFQVTYPKCLEDLEYEIGAVGGTSVRLEADFQSKQLRRDGFPYSDAAPVSHPGVILSFDIRAGRKTERLSFSCDAYSVWWHNLRDISLLLTDLRGVDRRRARSTRDTASGGRSQYEGYTAATHQIASAPPPETDPKKQAALRIIAAADWLGSTVTIQEVIAGTGDGPLVYRAAKRDSHPDSEGGSHDLFLQVIEDGRVLGYEK